MSERSEDRSIPQRVVEAIEEDLCDRRGLKWEFGRIEPDVQEEIREAWRAIVRGHVEPLETSRAELVVALEACVEYMEGPGNSPADGWGCLDRGADKDRREALARARSALEKAGLR